MCRGSVYECVCLMCDVCVDNTTRKTSFTAGSSTEHDKSRRSTLRVTVVVAFICEAVVLADLWFQRVFGSLCVSSGRFLVSSREAARACHVNIQEDAGVRGGSAAARVA